MSLDRRDGLDLDQPGRMRERRDLDQRRGRSLAREELLTDGYEIGAIADIGDIGIELDDAINRSAGALDQGFERPESLAGLPPEVAAMENAALLVVGDLARQEQDGLCTRHAYALGVGRRIEYIRRTECFDADHVGWLLALRKRFPAGSALAGFFSIVSGSCRWIPVSSHERR